jgi:Ca2+/H+ antiporter
MSTRRGTSSAAVKIDNADDPKNPTSEKHDIVDPRLFASLLTHDPSIRQPPVLHSHSQQQHDTSSTAVYQAVAGTSSTILVLVDCGLCQLGPHYHHDQQQQKHQASSPASGDENHKDTNNRKSGRHRIVLVVRGVVVVVASSIHLGRRCRCNWQYY